MACQVLEVTLISAEDLKRVTIFSKMRVYAVASISGGDPRLPTHRTYADREGGRNPTWHAPLRFTIPRVADPRAIYLHVLLRAERRAFGDLDVGEVFVPVQDLPAAAPGGGEQQRLSYQVRRPVSGRKRGVLHISYRLTDVPAATTGAPYNVHQYVQEAPVKRQQQHESGSAVTAYRAAERRPPPCHQHAHAQYVPSYSGPYPHHYQPYGYAGAPYGYGLGSAAPAARHDGAGMGLGLGLGLLSGAVGGLMLGDMIAGAEVMDGVGI